jgi:hypothetical protein
MVGLLTSKVARKQRKTKTERDKGVTIPISPLRSCPQWHNFLLRGHTSWRFYHSSVALCVATVSLLARVSKRHEFLKGRSCVAVIFVFPLSGNYRHSFINEWTAQPWRKPLSLNCVRSAFVKDMHPHRPKGPKGMKYTTAFVVFPQSTNNQTDRSSFLERAVMASRNDDPLHFMGNLAQKN